MRGVPADLLRTWISRLETSRLVRPVLAPTATSMRRIALAGVVADTAIMSTGAAVRLSSSGLGCPDWPRCSAADVVASKNAGQTLLNTWIEFGNRLLNFPLVAIAGLTFIAFFCWNRQQRAAGRRERKDLVWLSAVLPLGVVAQAVVGGIVVLTKLNPALVAVHFLLSTAIILTAAVVLHARAGALEQAGAPSTGQPASGPANTVLANTALASTGQAGTRRRPSAAARRGRSPPRSTRRSGRPSGSSTRARS